MNGSLVGVIASSLVAVVGPYLVYRSQKRSATTDAAQNQINQIQEDRQADREEFGKLASRFSERQQRLETRIEQLEAQIHVYSDYALQLRYHISEQKAPPPPPFPAELTRGLPGDR